MKKNMKRDCDNCGLYNAMMEACGYLDECHFKKNEEPSGWIPVLRRKVLCGRIRKMPIRKQK